MTPVRRGSQPNRLRVLDGSSSLGKRGGSERTAWVGAASFEERSVASLVDMSSKAATLSSIFIMNYTTTVQPAALAGRLRAANTRSIQQLGKRLHVDTADEIEVAPYSFGAFHRLLEEVLRKHSTVLIDVSCITKVHALAAAAVAVKAISHRIYIAYTTPENYPGLAGSSTGVGWRDIIVAPFGSSARFFNESSGRGIVVAGHEADRLIVALAEIEPAGGTVVIGRSKTRPDLGEVSHRRNKSIVRQLTSMRTADWKTVSVNLTDFSAMSAIAAAEIERAKKYDAPVILFPFGPKPLIFAAACELAAVYGENSWFVYPVPASYDIDYSEGIGKVIWVQVAS